MPSKEKKPRKPTLKQELLAELRVKQKDFKKKLREVERNIRSLHHKKRKVKLVK